MQCPQCGAAATDGQRFCGRCGAALVVACGNCGYENPGDHRFCGGCGTELSPQATQSQAVSAVERRVVSVLFVDMVGFTAHSEGRDPEDVRALITEYFDLARDVVGRFGGTVDKFIGDAVMAWWGATTTHEDDAERAVRSALELVERVVAMGGRVGIPGLSARAGVMTGEVSVGPGGNERGLLLGDLVNVASRLQALAEPGGVLVGESTATLVDTAIELVEEGSHHLKGRDQPVEVHRAVRVLAERGGRGRSELLEPPFVGRHAELRLLKDALEATGREGRARLVSLVGQAGIGKSRLVWEFRKYIDGLIDDVYWHEGRSPAYGDGLAMWALGEMIRRRAGIQESDGDDVTEERLSEAVAQHVDPEDRRWVGDRLAALLGVGESVGSERTELFAAARQFFEGIAAKGTVVLVFEDVHWADPSLLEFIDELPDWSQNHPILTVTLARPDLLDRRPDWGSGRRGLSSTYLGPLADGEMAELIGGAMPGIPQQAVDRIVATAGGVPLFAVEMLRMLLAEGRLVVGPTAVEVVGDFDALEVPGSVHAVVGARLDRLPPEDRDIARDAAVLGQTFTIESLAALREEQADKVERRLADLVRREIFELVRDPRSPERGQYRWVQGVVREVAYGRLSRSDRQDLHLRTARYLGGLDDPELAPVVAAHYVAASEAAGDAASSIQGEVAEALRAAIDRADVLHAHEQVISLVESALAVVTPGMEVDLRELAALAAVRLSDDATADRHLAAVTRLAEESGDPGLVHRAVALAGRVGNETRRPSQAAAALEPHLERYPEFMNDRNLARAAVYLARARLLVGDEDGAAELSDRALEAVERFEMLEDVADALVTRGTALSSARPNHAMALLRGALELAREKGFTDTLLRCLINIGYASHDFEESVRVSEEAFDLAKRVGDRSHASFVAGNLIGSYSVFMDHDAMDRVMADPVLSTGPTDRVHTYGSLAQLHLRRGQRQAAVDAIREAEAALAADVTDPQAILTFERSQASLATFDIDGRTTFEIGRRHFRETPFAPGLSVAIAAEGACITGDPAMLAEAAEMAATLVASPMNARLARWVGGVRAIVEGDIDGGVATIDEVSGYLADQRLRWVLVEVLTTAARHLPPDHPSRADYVARSRAIADETAAPGVRGWIDAMVG